jgi:hypothetical protein
MMRYKIEKRFIDKAVQIRKDFIKSLKVASNRQDIVHSYLNELNGLKDGLDDVKDKDEFIKKISEIEQKIIIIEKEMSFHIKKRDQLEKEEIKLCELVLERYPGITEDEIKEQIYPHIQNLQ